MIFHAQVDVAIVAVVTAARASDHQSGRLLSALVAADIVTRF
jgi:hypothetical protein